MGSEKKSLYDFLSPNNVLCLNTQKSFDEVRELLLGALKRHYPALDVNAARREVQAREEVFPTVISPGLSVPHARLAELEFPLMALVSAPEGITMAGASEPVRLVVLLLTPMTQPDLHLQLLSMLAATLSGEEIMGRLAALTTPDEVYQTLCRKKSARLTEYLTAADLMETPKHLLQETDTLAQAIRLFATGGEEELIVLDSVGDLRGTLSLTQLLKKSLPEHLLWMEDLAPIYRFQPFAEMLKTAGEIKIADVMNEEFLSVDCEVPAIQLAKLFLVHQVRQLIITRQGKFAGVVNLKDFSARLFWE